MMPGVIVTVRGWPGRWKTVRGEKEGKTLATRLEPYDDAAAAWFRKRGYELKPEGWVRT